MSIDIASKNLAHNPSPNIKGTNMNDKSIELAKEKFISDWV